MEETLISFETAKLAKEKQFQERTSYFYTIENGLCSIDTDGEILNIYNDDLTFKDSIWDCNGDFWYNEIENEEGIYAQTYEPIKYSAPTQSLLQKWLRELHGVDIHITRNKPSYREYRVEIYKVDDTRTYIHFQINEEKSNGCKWFDDYEEALETALLEALKLINK